MRNFLKLKTKIAISTSAFISILVGTAYAEDLYKTFPAVCYLANLNGTNGFAINGIHEDDRSGASVSGAGDVNGDGIADILIGAPRPGKPGQTYVIFGSKQLWSEAIDLSSLNGSNGFAINGTTRTDYSGLSVSGAGDVNGDNISDILIGSKYAGEDRTAQSYVVFGRKEVWPSFINLDSLNGINGFMIDGLNPDDQNVISVSGAGDVNGDGLSDILIGASSANNHTGKSYVVFGSKEPWSAVMDLLSLNGTNGFAVNGIHEGDSSGCSVSGAGDVNGDGIADILIGASGVNNGAGQSYIVFGSNEPWVAVIDVSSLNGINGFAINGIKTNDRSGDSVSGAGDVNGDGLDDILIGTNADGGANGYISQSYVIFGNKQGWPSFINLADLNGNNGFNITGINSKDYIGDVVSGAGDVNGDGIADILIGAWGVNNGAGQSYVVFGSNMSWPATINLVDLKGNNGFTINGIHEGDRSGHSVSGAGDMNGDGVDDILIGAFLANGYAGQSYVVFDCYGDTPPPPSSNTPLILGLTLGIGGGMILTAVSGYYGYQHWYHSGYTSVD